MGVIFSLLRRPERVGLLLSAFASVAACSDSAHSQATPAGGIHDGVPIYLKIDFDDGENPFDETFRSNVALLDDSTGSLSGKSLHVERAWNGGTIGVSTSLEVVGATDLRIAFMVRAREMPTIAVNAFDERHDDNTTPASPARIVENEWRPVVFALEDFHFNSDPPDQKIPAEDVELVSLLFHGGDGEAGASFAVDKVVVYRGVDRVPPAAPGDVAGVVDGGGVLLQWQEPSDGTFSVVYSVHRRNEKGSWEKIGESLRPSYRDASPKAGANVYRVTAADYENNVSAPSPELEVTAQATAPMATERDPPWVTDRAGYAANVREVHARGAANVRRDVFLFAGDSLTAPALYTQIVGSWLGRGLTVRRGVGTVTTEYGAANIGEYLTEAMPEFAIVMYGTNDVEHGLPNAYSMGNLEAIIDTAIMAGTVPIVATIPPRGYDKRSQEHQERFNSALIELARRKRVPVSYVFEEMMTQDLLAMLYDGVHLQPDTGNDAAGRALSRTMNEVYFALRDNSASW